MFISYLLASVISCLRKRSGSLFQSFPPEAIDSLMDSFCICWTGAMLTLASCFPPSELRYVNALSLSPKSFNGFLGLHIGLLLNHSTGLPVLPTYRFPIFRSLLQELLPILDCFIMNIVLRSTTRILIRLDIPIVSTLDPDNLFGMHKLVKYPNRSILDSICGTV
jgi:hypothetical protein